MMNYRNVIWDFNGTLLDDVQICLSIINKLLSERNLNTLSLDDYREIFTFPVEKYYSKLFDFSKESFESLGKEWMDHYEKLKWNASLTEGAKYLVQKLNYSGIHQHVLSAYSLDKLKHLLKHFDLLEYMENIKGLDNIYANSKLQLGLKLAEELELNSEPSVLIGDTLHDAEVAHAMGIDSILITTGHQSANKLKQNGNVVVENFKQLEQLLI